MPELTDEELDALPISAVMDGKVQTFPDAAALDEALNAEPVPEAAGNFHITDEHLGEGGAKQKYARNIAAIRTLFQLEQEHRGATAEEQEVLSQYVGWGGLADAFDPSKDSWAKEYAELKGLLSEDEYAAARSSTLNAHYTSPTVIRSIYDAVERMGFHSGNILEPSMGVGNFFGMLPESMADSRLYGVELDSITGRIAQKLYPEANIKVAGFETTDRRDFYDLAVGNVPFGNYKVNDKAYNKLNFSIHNYFFAKAIDQVRPGGIVAFVTSRYTMDSKDSTARKHMAERADLLGAIRLPNNAFKANSERAYITNTMTVSGAADDCAAKETSDFKQYEKAVTVTDTYHETKSRFAWIGEIENEQLLTALETLKVEDLEIITMYAYEGYDITEISKVYGVSRPTISIKIKRITKFLKNFNFNATN